MIDLRYVKKLVDMIDESSVDSIEISSDKGMKIRISKASVMQGVMPAPPSAPMHAASHSFVVGASSSAATTAAEPASKLVDVKSPMVGTFYPAPEPGAKPYVSVGATVAKGQVLCIVEAMKIMNEIECEVTGVIREICVTEAHPVEYGQVLFRIDPHV